LPDIRKVKRRIKGVQNIAKITRAMEMIAASKMRKAQERGLQGRPYAEKIEQVIADLAALPQTTEHHPLLQRRPVKKIAVVHITPDRGLAGGLNANLNRSLGNFILKQKEQDIPVDVISVIQALILLFVAADAIVRYIYRIRAKEDRVVLTRGWGG